MNIYRIPRFLRRKVSHSYLFPLDYTYIYAVGAQRGRGHARVNDNSFNAQLKQEKVMRAGWHIV